MKFQINRFVENINGITRMNGRIRIQHHIRTVIYPGNIADVFLVTDIGNDGKIIERKDQIRSLFVQKRRKPGDRGRIVSCVFIKKGKTDNGMSLFEEGVFHIFVSVTCPFDKQYFHVKNNAILSDFSIWLL